MTASSVDPRRPPPRRSRVIDSRVFEKRGGARNKNKKYIAKGRERESRIRVAALSGAERRRPLSSPNNERE